MSTSNDDCFFFYSSTCTKGDTCAFRHCEAARNSIVTCVFWKQNKCTTPQCPYRHSEKIKPIVQNKADQPCYFETVASGCTRPSCPFKHLKPRPHKVQKVSSGSSNNIITLVDATQDCGTSQPTLGTLGESDKLEGPVINPIIVNPAEDSDFDSPFSSPVKNVTQKSVSMSNIIDVASRKDLTFEENNSAPTSDSGTVAPSSTHQSNKISTVPKHTAPNPGKDTSRPSKSPTDGKVRRLSVKKSGEQSSAPPKQPDKQSGTPQQNRARKALAVAKERSKHAASHTQSRPEESTPGVNKEDPIEPKVISLKKKNEEKKEEVKSSDEENSDEDLGIKSLEQTLRERALRSMGIIELKSGRIVRTKDQPPKKEEPAKRRKRSSSDEGRNRFSGEEKSKKNKVERISGEKLPVHKRIGTVKRTSLDRKRSVEERNSQARNKEREERIRRLKLEQERENKRRQIIAAKRKARALKAMESVVVKKKPDSEDEDSEEEEEESAGEESSSEEGNKEVQEDEDLGEEVDIELGEGELSEEEEEEEVPPVKIVFDTRRAIRKSDSVENFTVKKSIPVQPVKAKVVQQVTIKKTFVVEPKEEKEKPKRKRRVILEDDDPAPLPVFSSHKKSMDIIKPVIVEVKKPKLEKKQEEKRLEPDIQPVIKPVVSAPKVKSTTNVWSRRAWDSKPKESGDSVRPSLGGIRSRLGIPGTVGSSGDTGSTEPKLKRRLGWRKTPVVSADEDADSDSSTSVKKAVSLEAVRARVGQKLTTGGGEESLQSDAKDDTRRQRKPIQIYVPPAKKRTAAPDDEETSKKRLVEKDTELFKEQIKPKEAKTFSEIMAEKRERQKKRVEEQKHMSSLDGSPSKTTYAPVKFAIGEEDLGETSPKSRLPGRSPLSVSNSVSSSLSTSPSKHLPASSSFSNPIISTPSSQSLPFIEKEPTNLISTEHLPDTPTDNISVSEQDNQCSILPQNSTNKSTVLEVRSTKDSFVGLSNTQDQICVEALPSDQKDSVETIASEVQQEEKKVSPAKRSTHNDSWLDIDIGDLDGDIDEEETNDDDLLREIDELLA